jgi:hypothetical protein
MSWPSIVTASASGFSREPRHTGHGLATMNFSISDLTHSESVSR